MQEEARKALQGLFQGKKDLLAAYDPDSGSGGAGKGGGKKVTGGSGAGDSGWQSPDWRDWSIQLRKRLSRSIRFLSAMFGFIGTLLQES